jgi:hypothetical protein
VHAAEHALRARQISCSRALHQQERLLEILGHDANAAKEARACVVEGYAWEHISAQLGQFMMTRANIAAQPLPQFSVVIPSYERPEHLNALIACLQAQLERDFEVIIIDQSSKPWGGAKQEFGFSLTYHHSPVKGAVRARNTGAMLAQGEVLAFIDDDCFDVAKCTGKKQSAHAF